MCRFMRPAIHSGGMSDSVRRRGATLLELLVVISLIGLLVGIMIPSLSRSMSAAANTMCKNNLREVGYALALYQYDNDGWLPNAKVPSAGLVSVRDSEPWFGKLFPMYLQDPAMLTCPEDPQRYRMLEAGHDIHDPIVSDYSSYGINQFILTAGGGELAQTQRVSPSRPLDTILAADSGPDKSGSGVRAFGAEGPDRNASLLMWDDGFDPFVPRPSSNSWVTVRHAHGINMLTMGGGVRGASSRRVLKRPLRRYYSDCAAGRCAFCNTLRLPHYSFASDRLYWWTASPAKSR